MMCGSSMVGSQVFYATTHVLESVVMKGVNVDISDIGYCSLNGLANCCHRESFVVECK